jgi:uncharacterized membrane protein
MEQYLPWLFIALAVALVIAALLYVRMSQVESD